MPEQDGQAAAQATTAGAGAVTTEATATDWRTSIPEDIRAEKALSDFKDVGSLAKSYVESQKFIGSSIRLPSEKDKPEDRTKKLDDIYTKLGRPAKPEEYKAGALPEGIPLSETHQQAFHTTAHKLGLNQSQVDGLYQFFGSYLGEGRQALATKRSDGEAALKKEWGANYENNTKLAHRGLASMAAKVLGEEGGKELLAELDRTGVGSLPALVKIFAALGAEMQEDGLITGDSDVSVEALEAQIAELTKQGTPFWDKFHPDHDKAVQQVERMRAQVSNPLLARS